MDRRQRKTREAIFSAFTELLCKKDVAHITVGEIIDLADVGRATFYSHFETKDFLLKEYCEDLFCHIFDSEGTEENGHRHIFSCKGTDEPFLHLLRHLKQNDNCILSLLSSSNNELFMGYFKHSLRGMIRSHLSLFADSKPKQVPDDFWEDHILSTFVETVGWWIKSGMTETPERINEYFFAVV